MMDNANMPPDTLHHSVTQVKLMRCASCHHWCALRPLVCPNCGSTSLGLEPIKGQGYVRSLSVVHRAPDAQWRTMVPYTVVLVDTDEGPALMGHAAEGLRIGDRVRAEVFAPHGQHLIRFVRGNTDSQI